MKNIYIIGMPGCGKTTVSGLLAQRLLMDLIDLDRAAEAFSETSISDIFAKKGELYFRRLEGLMLAEASRTDNCVISTGGGIIKAPANISLMKNSGTIVFIDTPPELIIKNADLSSRPLIGGDKTKLYEIYNERYAVYSSVCDFAVGGGLDIEATINDIVKGLKKWV